MDHKPYIYIYENQQRDSKIPTPLWKSVNTSRMQHLYNLRSKQAQTKKSIHIQPNEQNQNSILLELKYTLQEIIPIIAQMYLPQIKSYKNHDL